MTVDKNHKDHFFNMRPEILVCLFLVIATLAVYWQVKNFVKSANMVIRWHWMRLLRPMQSQADSMQRFQRPGKVLNWLCSKATKSWLWV